MMDSDSLTMSYSALAVTNGLTKFVFSAAFGFIWSSVSPLAGFPLAALMMVAGIVALLINKAK